MRYQAATNKKAANPQGDTHCSAKPARGVSAPFYPLGHVQQLIGNHALGHRVQAKLNVSEPGDVHEQEADRIADQVMRMPATPGAAVPPSGNPLLPLQSTISPGAGQLLPESARTFFGPRFDNDFRDVQVHTDAHATESAQQLGARAYTVGRNIVFGAGEYSPDTTAGKRLLAHELAHVTQNQRDNAIDSDRIQRQDTPDPEAGSDTDPLRLRRPYSFADVPLGSGLSLADDLFRLGDPLWLLKDVLGDLIWQRPTGKEAEAFKLKGYESAGLFTLGFGSVLGATGIGGEQITKGMPVGKNFGVWKKYVDALQPLTPSDSAIMDSLSFLLRMRLDEYLASDLFLSRLKSHPFGALVLLGAAEAGYYKIMGGPGEAGKLTTTPDWNRATGLPTKLIGAILSEKLKPPKFFDLLPMVMKTHPGFAYTPFSGEAPPQDLTAEGAVGSGPGEGGESYKFSTSLNLAKLLLVPEGLKPKDLDDLRKYRGTQSSIWLSFDSLDPTQTMAAAGRLPESKLKAGTLFGAGGYMGMLEMGATYDQPMANKLTSWFIKGGFGYSGPIQKVIDRIGFRATMSEGGTMEPVNEIFLNRLALTATYMGYKPEYNLAPTGPGGTPAGGWAARFTPSLGLDFITGKSKLSFGSALSFVTGSTEDFAVADVSPYVAYTRLGDTETGLPRFKATVNFSASRLDWWNKNSPWLYGVQSTLQAGPLFGGVQVMTGAGAISESRAAQMDEAKTVKKNTAVLFVTGAAF